MLSNLEIIGFKKLLTAKLDEAAGLVQFWLSSKFFFIQLFPNWTACSPITYTKCRKMWFLKPAYFLMRTQIFAIILSDTIGLEKFLLSSSQSWSRTTMCNLHWCYIFCSEVTLELHCSQPIRIFSCTSLSFIFLYFNVNAGKPFSAILNKIYECVRQ